MGIFGAQPGDEPKTRTGCLLRRSNVARMPTRRARPQLGGVEIANSQIIAMKESDLSLYCLKGENKNNGVYYGHSPTDSNKRIKFISLIKTRQNNLLFLDFMQMNPSTPNILFLLFM